MEVTFLFLFWGWCITSIIVNGKIFDPLKNYLVVKSPFLFQMTMCVMCTGFWIGFLVFTPSISSGVINPLFTEKIPYWMNFIIFPFLQSGISVLIESFLIFLVKKKEN